MKFSVSFKASRQAFTPDFGKVYNVSDGGFERGYEAGYGEALASLTNLIVTENGEYTPTDDSTGFNHVSVNVPQAGGLVYDSGSVIIASDTASIEIQHKLATNPMLFYIWSEPRNSKSVFVTGTAVYAQKSSAYITQGFGYNSSGAVASLTGTGNVVKADQDSVTLQVHLAYPLKANETYHWIVAAKINPISELEGEA